MDADPAELHAFAAHLARHQRTAGSELVRAAADALEAALVWPQKYSELQRERDALRAEVERRARIIAILKDDNADLDEHNNALQARAERAEALADVLRQDRCKSFTSGLGSCFRYGRQERAEYGADQACVPCIIERRLSRAAAALRSVGEPTRAELIEAAKANGVDMLMFPPDTPGGSDG